MTIYCYQRSDKSIVHWRSDKKQLDKECLLNEIDVSECCLIETSEEPKEGYDGLFYLKGYAPEKPVEQKQAEVRAVRNQCLADTDKYMIPDFPITEEEREEYKAYRVYLRDYTKTENWYESNPQAYEEWKEELNATEQIKTMGDVYGTVQSN